MSILASVIRLELLVHFLSHLEVDVHSLVVDLLLQLLNILGQLGVLHVESVDLSVSLDKKIISGVKLDLLSLDQLLQSLELLLVDLLLSIVWHWVLDGAHFGVGIEVLRLERDE